MNYFVALFKCVKRFLYSGVESHFQMDSYHGTVNNHQSFHGYPYFIVFFHRKRKESSNWHILICIEMKIGQSVSCRTKAICINKAPIWNLLLLVYFIHIEFMLIEISMQWNLPKKVFVLLKCWIRVLNCHLFSGGKKRRHIDLWTKFQIWHIFTKLNMVRTFVDQKTSIVKMFFHRVWQSVNEWKIYIQYSRCVSLLVDTFIWLL